ncbi:hypothetical protein ACFYXC_19780 [Streptomyces sp. NPDC002701]|uniref:hypothetical protein n=1 Tax=Streptomyces sp. NPDC002701 TaxID=3364661 RepID=UPI0036919D55
MVITVLAAVIGLVVGIRDLFPSDPAPPSASGPGPEATARTDWPSSDVTPTSAPRDRVTQSPFEEAPPPESTPDPVEPTTEDPAVEEGGAESPQHGGALTVRIKMGAGGKVGADTFRAGSTPGANTEVYDDTGQLDRGCYVKWTLKRGSEVVRRHTSERCRPPSITLFNFGDSLDEPGSYTLTAAVTTDWRQAGNETVAFEVVPD